MNTLVEEHPTTFKVTAVYSNTNEILYTVHNETGALIDHVFTKEKFARVAVYRKDIASILRDITFELEQTNEAIDNLERQLAEHDERRPVEYDEIIESQLHSLEVKLAELLVDFGGLEGALANGQKFQEVRVAYYVAKDPAFAKDLASFRNSAADRIVVINLPEPTPYETEETQQAA
jgi:hypothetical protein